MSEDCHASGIDATTSTCFVCGAHRDRILSDTWFTVTREGQPPQHVCSRDCLTRFAFRIAPDWFSWRARRD